MGQPGATVQLAEFLAKTNFQDLPKSGDRKKSGYARQCSIRSNGSNRSKRFERLEPLERFELRGGLHPWQILCSDFC